MSKVSLEGGRKRVNRGVRRPMAEWDVLLKDQHEGYISWSEMEKIEQEKHERGSVAAVGRQLDHAERGDAVGAHAARRVGRLHTGVDDARIGGASPASCRAASVA
jgi:hypothetical protein